MAISIDEQIQKIKDISKELETGGLSLEAALKKYEEGVKLIRQCSGQIEKVEKRIEFLEKGDQNELYQ